MCIVGPFRAVPIGVILHGSRSGIERSTDAELQSTINYAVGGALDSEGDNLGWNATIGPATVARHIDPKYYGWNAREASSVYVAAEFAQGLVADPIDDTAVDAFCWWFINVVRVAWPTIPALFVTHASLPAGIRDRKTDAFPIADPRAADLIARIHARLGE